MLNWSKVSSGVKKVARKIGSAAAHTRNAVDTVADAASSGAAHVANVADDVKDTVVNAGYNAKNAVTGAVDDIKKGASTIKDEVVEGFDSARNKPEPSYQEIRNKSPRVQREIEEGIRNPDGTRKPKVKEARTQSSSESANPTPKTNSSGRETVEYQGATYEKIDGKWKKRRKTGGEQGAYFYEDLDKSVSELTLEHIAKNNNVNIDNFWKKRRAENRGKWKNKQLGEKSLEAATGLNSGNTNTSDYRYRSRMENGNEIFERQVGNSDWEIISNTEYADARRRTHSNTSEFSESLLVPSEVREIVQETSESGAGWWDGIPGWAKNVGFGTATFVAGGFLLDDDDE